MLSIERDSLQGRVEKCVQNSNKLKSTQARVKQDSHNTRQKNVGLSSRSAARCQRTTTNAKIF